MVFVQVDYNFSDDINDMGFFSYKTKPDRNIDEKIKRPMGIYFSICVWPCIYNEWFSKDLTHK